MMTHDDNDSILATLPQLLRICKTRFGGIMLFMMIKMIMMMIMIVFLLLSLNSFVYKYLDTRIQEYTYMQDSFRWDSFGDDDHDDGGDDITLFFNLPNSFLIN